jgi:hypothetical protein
MYWYCDMRIKSVVMTSGIIAGGCSLRLEAQRHTLRAAVANFSPSSNMIRANGMTLVKLQRSIDSARAFVSRHDRRAVFGSRQYFGLILQDLLGRGT